MPGSNTVAVQAFKIYSGIFIYLTLEGADQRKIFRSELFARVCPPALVKGIIAGVRCKINLPSTNIISNIIDQQQFPLGISQKQTHGQSFDDSLGAGSLAVYLLQEVFSFLFTALALGNIFGGSNRSFNLNIDKPY